MPILIHFQDSTREEHMGTLKEKKDPVIDILCAPLHHPTCTKLVEKHGGLSIMLVLAPSFTIAVSSWVIGWHREERASKDHASWFHCPFPVLCIVFLWWRLVALESRGQEKGPIYPLVGQFYLTKSPPELNHAPPCFASAKVRRMID